MLLRFLGTGTSYGVPFVGCDCAVCRSPDPRDTRLRAAIAVEEEATRVLVDTGPDLRAQLLRAGITRADALFWTHDHNDHVIGLDDVRPLSDASGYLPGYADAATLTRLQHVFDYIFVPGRGSGIPRVTGHVLAPFESVQVGPLRATALPIQHGRRAIFAWEFAAGGQRLVYATDCSGIPAETRERMRGADVLVLDALRHAPHGGHFHLAAALEMVRELAPGRAFFTHIAHDLAHEATNATLPANVQLAYDGLEVTL